MPILLISIVFLLLTQNSILAQTPAETKLVYKKISCKEFLDNLAKRKGLSGDAKLELAVRKEDEKTKLPLYDIKTKNFKKFPTTSLFTQTYQHTGGTRFTITFKDGAQHEAPDTGLNFPKFGYYQEKYIFQANSANECVLEKIHVYFKEQGKEKPEEKFFMANDCKSIASGYNDFLSQKKSTQPRPEGQIILSFPATPRNHEVTKYGDICANAQAHFIEYYIEAQKSSHDTTTAKKPKATSSKAPK